MIRELEFKCHNCGFVTHTRLYDCREFLGLSILNAEVTDKTPTLQELIDINVALADENIELRNRLLYLTGHLHELLMLTKKNTG